MADTPTLRIECLIEHAGWHNTEIESLAQTAFSATAEALGYSNIAMEISLLACDDQRIASLNSDFRGKSVPTNVLSWPTDERAAKADGAAPKPLDAFSEGVIELGDIAIAYQTCVREADAEGKTFPNHAIHLLVHSALHLFGYDHERDGDAALMEATEIRILGKLGIPNPY